MAAGTTRFVREWRIRFAPKTQFLTPTVLPVHLHKTNSFINFRRRVTSIGVPMGRTTWPFFRVLPYRLLVSSDDEHSDPRRIAKTCPEYFERELLFSLRTCGCQKSYLYRFVLFVLAYWYPYFGDQVVYHRLYTLVDYLGCTWNWYVLQ